MIKKFKQVSIIIPVFNEERTIAEIIERVVKANTLQLKKEIIVIDDGSTDRTHDILEKFSSKSIRVYTQLSNRGKGEALRLGLKMAKGEVILFQDADLEYDPVDYPALLEPIISGKSKIVYDSRMLNNGVVQHGGLSFYVGGKFINLLTNKLYNIKLTDVMTGYKVFDALVLKSLSLGSKHFELCPEITAKLATSHIPICEVSISYKGRKISEGKKINWLDGIHVIWTLFKYRYLGKHGHFYLTERH